MHNGAGVSQSGSILNTSLSTNSVVAGTTSALIWPGQNFPKVGGAKAKSNFSSTMTKTHRPSAARGPRTILEAPGASETLIAVLTWVIHSKPRRRTASRSMVYIAGMYRIPFASPRTCACLSKPWDGGPTVNSNPLVMISPLLLIGIKQSPISHSQNYHLAKSAFRAENPSSFNRYTSSKQRALYD